jgi:pyrrolidone-carboxylate peptidase
LKNGLPNRQPEIFVYGFGPYLNHDENVSQAIVERLRSQSEVSTEVFDVRFSRSMILDTLNAHDPAVIIGLGQHPRARKLRLEKKAVNLMQGPGGNERKIDDSGPAVRRANLVLPENKQTTITYDAGTYVCNYSMYICLEYCERQAAQFAFMHIPMNYDPRRAAGYLQRAIDLARARG